MSEHSCGKPDIGTYKGQVVMVAPDWLKEKWPSGIGIDICLALEIQSLWAMGVKTNGHCCGHGKVDPFISVGPDSVYRMLELGYRNQEHPLGLNDHFWPMTQLTDAAHTARMFAHHALWYGLIPYGAGQEMGKFGVGLANRIADAIDRQVTIR